MALSPKEIAERAASIAQDQGDSELGDLARLVAELALGLDVFFSTLQELGAKQ